MKKSKKKKNKKRIANNYLGMAAIAIVVLLLLGGLTYQSQTLKARMQRHRRWKILLQVSRNVHRK